MGGESCLPGKKMRVSQLTGLAIGTFLLLCAPSLLAQHGGHGGSASAPVIHDVFQRYFQLYPPPPKPEIARVLEDSPPSQ